MNKKNNLILFSIFCCITSLQLDAATIFFYYNPAKNADQSLKYPDQSIRLTLQISPGSVHYTKGLSLNPQWQNYESITIKPATTFNIPNLLGTTVYPIDGTGFRINVEATNPIQIKGQQGEVFFEGQNGILNAKIPGSAIWHVNINDL